MEYVTTELGYRELAWTGIFLNDPLRFFQPSGSVLSCMTAADTGIPHMLSKEQQQDMWDYHRL